MNRFYNIQEAISYLSPCLLCKYGMGLDCLSGSPDSQLNYGYGDFSPVITYSIMDKSFEDKFMINVRSNEVKRDIVTHREEYVVGGYDGTNSYAGKTSFANPQTSGTRYLYLGGSCRNCRKYGYVLQIIIRLQPLTLTDVVFNSETVTFQANEMGERWELKNIYTTKQTVYSHFAPPVPGTIVQEAKQNFPLLPLDREDPSKTLKRVKNLLIFT
jgi:hypothetical protein